MSSLNSQESSNDISRLTDRQQAEYHSAYQDYISHMAQMETERPAQAGLSSEDKTKDGEQEGRKPFKRNLKPAESMADYANSQDAGQLHPITEEEEKPERGAARKASVSRGRYHSVPSREEEEEEESGNEETDATPLLWEEQRAAGEQPLRPKAAKSFISAVTLDKKESSDSGMRSSGSSSDRSLEEEEEEEKKPAAQEEERLIQLVLDSPVRKRLSSIQDPAVARMSICSEAPSEGSPPASSPEENWPASAVNNLNRAASDVPLNNNNGNEEDQTNSTPLIIGPGTATLHNQNLLGARLRRTTSTGRDTDGSEERESVLWRATVSYNSGHQPYPEEPM